MLEVEAVEPHHGELPVDSHRVDVGKLCCRRTG